MRGRPNRYDPVAVPEIRCSLFARRISTAATRPCSLHPPPAALAGLPTSIRFHIKLFRILIENCQMTSVRRASKIRENRLAVRVCGIYRATKPSRFRVTPLRPLEYFSVFRCPVFGGLPAATLLLYHISCPFASLFRKKTKKGRGIRLSPVFRHPVVCGGRPRLPEPMNHPKSVPRPEPIIHSVRGRSLTPSGYSSAALTA